VQEAERAQGMEKVQEIKNKQLMDPNKSKARIKIRRKR